MKPGDAEIALSIAERTAVRLAQLAAGRDQHGVAGGDVPFRGRPEPRIEIGRAFGEQAEFQRRAAGDSFAACGSRST